MTLVDNNREWRSWHAASDGQFHYGSASETDYSRGDNWALNVRRHCHVCVTKGHTNKGKAKRLSSYRYEL